MGYQVDYKGIYHLNKPLTNGLYKYLVDFSKSRHVKRAIDDFGYEGEYYIDPDEYDKIEEIRKANIDLPYDEYHKMLYETLGIIDYNEPPATQPALWCSWIPTTNKLGIKWDGSEKFYQGYCWLIYIIQNFLRPNGYILNGETLVIDYELREYRLVMSKLCVRNNNVFITY